MKMTTIQISYDSEKLCVLRQHMKEGTDLEASLEAFLQALYENHVPGEVRETIDGQKAGKAI